MKIKKEGRVSLRESSPSVFDAPASARHGLGIADIVSWSWITLILYHHRTAELGRMTLID